MSTDLTNQLEVLEKPLKFASKNNFKNLSKVKNLEKVIEDITLKLIAQEKDLTLKKELEYIKNSFTGFESKEEKNKIVIINSTLKRIANLNNKASSTLQTSPDTKKQEINSNIQLKDPIRYLKGVGPRISDILSKKEIKCVEDLLFYFPRKYEDRRNIKKISSIDKLERVVIFGKVIDFNVTRLRSKKIFNVVISDGTGTLNLVWFTANEKYLKNTYKTGVNIVVSGEISYNNYNKNLQIIHPRPEDIEIFDDQENIEDKTHFGRIVPIYPLTEGLKQKRIRTIVKLVVDQFADSLINIIPEEILKNKNLLDLSESIKEVQFPEENDQIVDLNSAREVFNSKPHKTVAFYEFFLLEVGLSLKKREIVKRKGVNYTVRGNLYKKFVQDLPYHLTGAQLRVVDEIFKDMNSNFPMNRLLQGDVGSGKTVVSIISMITVVENGYQAVLMAPTEILCEQHYHSIKILLKAYDINVVLLKSGIKTKEKRAVNKLITTGKAQVIVGTHALIEDNVKFNNLGFVVIDEQHRFGVMQRAKLMGKGQNPDVLVMTATPIPRTLAITVYGDLDISTIDEMPPGRKKVETKLYKDSKRNRSEIYRIIKNELEKGRQCYVVCPFIDESENPDFQHIKYAKNVFETLRNEIFSEVKIGLLHGKMDNDEKENVMNSFVSNKIQLLVSTTVVEVGVDVSNATIMLIENSERYGLSQLHQLRGRVGRGGHESVCILVADYALSENADHKLEIMTKTNDGFKIAEADLQLRGPGDFLGTKQSGIPQFNFANLIRDWKILSEARDSAVNLVSSDPELTEVPLLKKLVESKWGELLELNVLS
jgi:ATP-dependent DNA helicase RecG